MKKEGMMSNKKQSIDAYCNSCEVFICDQSVTFEETCDRCGTSVEYIANQSEKKQSSVEWFAEELKQHLEKHGCISQKMLSIHFNRANAMHKKEIEEAWKDGSYDGSVLGLVNYYEETFGGENE